MGAVKNHCHEQIATASAASALGIPCEWLDLTFDRWTGDYRDYFNNVWVTRSLGRKLWTVAYRGAGNATVVESRHRRLELALAAARDALVRRYV